MPTYDFRCSNCSDKVLDIVLSVKDAQEGINCPSCGAVMKIIIRPAILKFSGSGWSKDGCENKKQEKTKKD